MSILEVNNVSIRYMVGDFKEIGLKEFFMRKLTKNYHIKEFWADREISFSLEKGDMLGIIGTNGAGKSTLLKVISGIMEPTKGWVKREGTIAALLELGSGFDGDLTVRENTYLRGAMLGYTRKFMDETYDDIITFAELEEFQDRPFKQLSSGMKSRLAFSIASLVCPDILILDEVLSVGDGAFKKKSEMRMREVLSSGATTILVSHSIDQVREMCNKILWLHKGEQVIFGDNVDEICNRYTEFLSQSTSTGIRLTDVSIKRDMKDRIASQKIIPGRHPMKYILEEVKGADWLVVTFSGFARKGASILKPYSFMKVCDDIKCHKLFLQDSLGARGTYYMVQNMDFSVADQVINWIEEVRKKLHIKKENVILIGGSKGGSASLYFGLRGHYGHVISMAPQTKIGSYVKYIDDCSQDMFQSKNIEGSIKILDNLLYDLEKDNNETNIHLYLSENDGLYDVQFTPFIEQIKSCRSPEKIDITIDNRIQSHSDHVRFNASFTEKKLAQILFGVRIHEIKDDIKRLLISMDESLKEYKMYAQIEDFSGKRNTIFVDDNKFTIDTEYVKRMNFLITKNDIIVFKKQIYSCIENLVSISYQVKDMNAIVKFNTKDQVKGQLTYAMYVFDERDIMIKTYWYQKENEFIFSLEKDKKYSQLQCFWKYEEEMYFVLVPFNFDGTK